jgi:hypothetical protein
MLVRRLLGMLSLRRTLRLLPVVGALLLPLASARPAAADPYTLDSGWTSFYFGDAGSTATPSPFSFTAPAGGAIVKATDAFLYGDRFELFDFGTSLGMTSVPGIGVTTSDPDLAYDSPLYSKGVFFVGAGNHEITIVATNSPFNGGGAYFRADAASAPEPGSMALLAMGALPLLRRLRRKREPVSETL